MKFNVKIYISDYHKIFDFKSTYVYLFEEKLQNSIFLGYFYMDLNSFISNDVLERNF